METSLTSFSETVRENIVRFLWREWSTLGIAGSSRSANSWLVDPEALLLFSTTFARYDSRLFDEIIDWLEVNGSMISLVRLSRMHSEEPLGTSSVLAAIAGHLGNKFIQFKWQSLQKDVVPQSPVSLLFPDVPVFGKCDQEFERWGWQREEFELRGMSQPPKPDRPETFLFQLRGLFGRQARAEVFAWLLTHEMGNPSQIAKETCYYKRTIQQLLNEMEAGGHVRSFRQGREKVFAIHREDWANLANWKVENHKDIFPKWINWGPLFNVLEKFVATLNDPHSAQKSVSAQAVALRELMIENSESLVKSGLAKKFRSHPAMKGNELIEAVIEDLNQIFPGKEID